jgi:hypothetical protein
VDDVVHLDDGGQSAAVFQRLAVDGQGLGQEQSALLLAVQLELDSILLISFRYFLNNEILDEIRSQNAVKNILQTGAQFLDL